MRHPIFHFSLSPFPLTFAALQPPILHKLQGQHLWLSPLRAIYWEDQQVLILADMHFGKTGHFRKSGIAVPQQVYKEDLQRFVALLQHFRPKQILAIGDLFHSHMNSELDWFKKWREGFAETEFILIRGNHDILRNEWYASAGIRLIEEELRLPPFRFIHDNCSPEKEYTFCGHLHPGVVISGAGRQSLRFPCFHFGENQAILPAFSRFTGMATVRPSPGDNVFAIVEETVWPLT